MDVIVAALYLTLSLAWLVLVVYIVRARRLEAGRFAQLVALCDAQQRWIRRGEVACVDCPELGSCVVRGACERES